ncbi:MAG: hypothetical protein ACKODX_17650, partial [Gemmata sp.]
RQQHRLAEQSPGQFGRSCSMAQAVHTPAQQFHKTRATTPGATNAAFFNPARSKNPDRGVPPEAYSSGNRPDRAWRATIR